MARYRLFSVSRVWDSRQGTGDRGHETGERREETGDRGQGTEERRQGTVRRGLSTSTSLRVVLTSSSTTM
ncbi:hypothetical protein EYF80_048422 [Liparis tanakae]|uniref:Uncharacterized protein n=1 Tax=Liparis tanakae TaxID=230148 RepID=A0A4Z2FKA3_9TELE|nr:hypothetical protein EYF80_048422 [Liparis tanakae]